MTSKLGIFIGIVTNLCLTILPLLLKDWYGFGSTIAVDISILCRAYMINELRKSVDHAATHPHGHLRKDPKTNVKTMCILSDNKAVTVYAPRHVVVQCFLSPPRPEYPRVYGAAQAIAWACFGSFAICIGQATFLLQLVTVVLTVSATVLIAHGFGSDIQKPQMHLGNQLEITREVLDSTLDRRIVAYAGLDMNASEEAAMVEWALMPKRDNADWWKGYTEYKLKGEAIEPKERHTGDTG